MHHRRGEDTSQESIRQEFLAEAEGRRELTAGRPELGDLQRRRGERDDGVRGPGQRAARPAHHAVRLDDRTVLRRQGLPDWLVQRRQGPAALYLAQHPWPP